jgi:hypothetical protein
LAYEDCYRAAIENEDHTLYLIRPPWISSATTKLFNWQEEPDRRRLYASSQAQEGIGFEPSTLFAAPPNISQLPRLPQQELATSTAVKSTTLLVTPPNIQQLLPSTEGDHRDKIGRGPDQRNKGGRRKQNRIGMSFNENKIGIRKSPGNMRITTASQMEPRAQNNSQEVRKPRIAKTGTPTEPNRIEQCPYSDSESIQ